MKLKKLYTYTNKRQLWRLLPTDSGKIVIEERDLEKKQVFFNCIKTESGKPVFTDYQFDEKYWVGIEAVTGDLILFHRFVKPELPAHKGIITFDIQTQSVIWETMDYNFLFIDKNKVYAFRSGFEGKEFFVLDLFTGELLESLGDNADAVNIMKQNSHTESYYENFVFPSSYSASDDNNEYHNLFKELKDSQTITGKIDYLEYKGVLLINFHQILKEGTLRNTFIAIEIETKRIIFEEILNAESKTIMPDSFFMVNDYLLLLKEKTKLIVCSLQINRWS